MKYKYIVLTKHRILVEILQAKLGPDYLVIGLAEIDEDIKFIKIDAQK